MALRNIYQKEVTIISQLQTKVVFHWLYYIDYLRLL